MRSVFNPHLLHIQRFPGVKLIELVLIILLINLVFAALYNNIYQSNQKAFRSVFNETQPISFFDFFYFANTIFFSLGDVVVPASQSAKILCITQMIVSFVAITIMLSNIIQTS